MSSTAEFAPARPSADVLATATVVGAGMALLCARVAVLGTGRAHLPLTVAIFVVLLGGSLLMTGTDRPRPIGATIALVVGVGALGLAAALLPATVPLPAMRWTVPLVVLAAVAEEAFFRRAMYGAIERWVPGRAAVPLAVVVSATLFAAIHVPLYGTAAIPLDLGAGVLLSWQRWASGTWTVPAATHVTANLLAVLA